MRSERLSKLDIVILGAGALLAVDSVIVPFISGGQTLHEMVGIPPPGDYKVLGNRTLQQAEAAAWGVSWIYCAVKSYWPRHS